ncbi:MAG: hypothetical protein WBJ91_07635, partial [Dethiobacteria bacterium]
YNTFAHPVSIHAPVRGATDSVPQITGPGFVSIHAPVRGATVMLKIPYTSNTFKQIFANLSFMKLLFRDNRGNNVPNH